MQYRPEIDGLRAVAVVPVILFHAGITAFSGGFVGVDVFFVISGYLITGILLAELQAGDFSIARFYERRARRILPALFSIILVCLPLAWLWMTPSQMKDFGQSILAISLFVSNLHFWREDDYFAPAAELSPLLHTWSLSVEEQFYLIFPVFLFLAWRFGRNRVVWLIALLALLSLGLSELGWRHAPSANFYFAPTRAWELLSGGLCAFFLQNRQPLQNNLLAIGGLVLIAISVAVFDHHTPFPSLYALLPVVGTCLIILCAPPQTLVGRILACRPFVAIGLVSYSAYLWHQPLFAFARIRIVPEPSNLVFFGLAVLVLPLSYLTWRYVEQPFRNNAGSALQQRNQVFWASGIVILGFATLGLFAHFQKGFPERQANGFLIGALDHRMRANYGLDLACEGKFTHSDKCATDANPDVLVWGDSYGMHIVDGLLADEPKLALRQHTTSSCSPVLGIAQVKPGKPRAWAQGCIIFNDQVFDWLAQNQNVTTVVLSSPWKQVIDNDLLQTGGDMVPSDRAPQIAAQKLLNTAQKIRALGRKLIIVSPTVRSDFDVGQCLASAAYFGLSENTCDFPAKPEPKVIALLQQVEKDIPVLWIDRQICVEQSCDTWRDDVFIYRDNGHLSREGAAFLGNLNNWSKTILERAR